jgi:hypothetical protein
MTRLERIGETLYPRDPSYSAEPIDIEDARWLYDHVNGCPETPAQLAMEILFPGEPL